MICTKCIVAQQTISHSHCDRNEFRPFVASQTLLICLLWLLSLPSPLLLSSSFSSTVSNVILPLVYLLLLLDVNLSFHFAAKPFPNTLSNSISRLRL